MKPQSSRNPVNIWLFLLVNLETVLLLLGLATLFGIYGRILTMAVVGLTATTGLL